jgi:hypothetical protein
MIASATGWYAAHQKPAREGVYQRLYAKHNVLYCEFRGGVWMAGTGAIDGSLRQGESAYQDGLPWRGLTEESS